MRLPRAEVDFLLTHAKHHFEITPTFERRKYHLTPRGFVGFIDGPTYRYAIGPKIAWPNLRLLLGLSDETPGQAVEPKGGLLAMLAIEFAEQLEALTRTGLVAGYREAEVVSTFLRGKLRTADQMRDVAARAFPDRFHIEEEVFDLNTPWNRIPKATASALLRRELPVDVRQRVEVAAQALASVPDSAVTDADFAAALAEPRAASYRPLLEVCRLVLSGFAAADPIGSGCGAFLIDLGREFERYLTRALERELSTRPNWNLQGQPAFALGPTELQPDIVIRKDGAAWAVLDAKWKTTTLEASDLHQVLAYATLTGASRVGLVYPGRTDRRTHFTTPDGRVRVSRYRLRVVGTTAELAASITKLARAV